MVVLCPAFRLVTRHDSTTQGTAASVQNAGRGVASPQRASQVPKDVWRGFERKKNGMMSMQLPGVWNWNTAITAISWPECSNWQCRILVFEMFLIVESKTPEPLQLFLHCFPCWRYLAFHLMTQHDFCLQAAAPRRSASMQIVRRVSTSPPRASQVPKDVRLVLNEENDGMIWNYSGWRNLCQCWRCYIVIRRLSETVQPNILKQRV